jgi:hypothetical protein
MLLDFKKETVVEKMGNAKGWLDNAGFSYVWWVVKYGKKD